MSLTFLVDGCNVINHKSFCAEHKKYNDPRLALLDLIRRRKLTGSLKNPVIVIYDGYLVSEVKDKSASFDIEVYFSGEVSADERIKETLERSSNPKDTIVVSDDKEIISFARMFCANVLGVESFVQAKKKAAMRNASENSKLTLSFTKAHQITEELKKIWLK